METFLTDTIVNAFDDPERTRYEIQAQLKEKRQIFDKKILYPHMAELIETRQDLNTIHQHDEYITESLKETADITKIDLLNEIIERENITEEMIREEIRDVLDLVDWAFPLVENTLSIGKEVFDETIAAIDIDWVNLISRYPNEGYLIIAVVDNDGEKELRVFSFQRRKYIPKGNDPTYVLRTTPKSVDSNTDEPEQLKQVLLAERTEKERAANPNPATIFIDTSVAYPFQPTVFPVAKRMLLRWFLQEEELDKS